MPVRRCLEKLLHLVRACTNLPIGVMKVSPVLTHVLAAFEREHLAQELPLNRLTRHEVGEMLKAIFTNHDAVSVGFLDRIYALTEGNPFFVEEVFKSLLATGELRSHDGVWERTLLVEHITAVFASLTTCVIRLPTHQALEPKGETDVNPGSSGRATV